MYIENKAIPELWGTQLRRRRPRRDAALVESLASPAALRGDAPELLGWWRNIARRLKQQKGGHISSHIKTMKLKIESYLIHEIL